MQMEVLVTPNSRFFRLAFAGGRWKAWVKAKPEDGKANKELVKELSKLLNCSVGLVRGASSRHKVLILEIGEHEFAERTRALMEGKEAR